MLSAYDTPPTTVQELAAQEAALKAKIEADAEAKRQKEKLIQAAKSGSGAKSRMAAFNMMAEGETGLR